MLSARQETWLIDRCHGLPLWLTDVKSFLVFSFAWRRDTRIYFLSLGCAAEMFAMDYRVAVTMS